MAGMPETLNERRQNNDRLGKRWNCTAVDAAFHTEGYGPIYPNAHWHFPQGTCKLMVVFAGSVRSGSTVNQVLGWEAINQGLVGSTSLVNFEYWRNSRHLGKKDDTSIKGILHQLKTTAQTIPKKDRKNSNHNNSSNNNNAMVDIVLAKTHQYDTELLRICDNNLIITLTRDPVKLLSSAVGARWISRKATTCDKLVERLDGVLQNYLCYVHAATNNNYKDNGTNSKSRTNTTNVLDERNHHLHYQFNDMQGEKNQRQVSKAMALKIAKIIGTQVKKSYLGSFMKKEANKLIPSSKVDEFEASLVEPCTAPQLRATYVALTNKKIYLERPPFRKWRGGRGP